MTQGDFLYEGKAKRIFHVEEEESLIFVEYKNSLTAFNGEKKVEMDGKGKLNCQITALIFEFLNKSGVPSHWRQNLSDTTMICEKLNILPIEVVVRNRLAGSTAKRFKIEEGTKLEKPLVEFYYKEDDLGDPFISDDQALMLKAANSQEQLDQLKSMALLANKILIKLFDQCGIDLIDFKLEYGTNIQGRLVLADEITPDTCRLWDKETGEKLDKDRFRRGLGNVIESYQEVYNRLLRAKENS